jgi:drug/metabolite transporter (DMT)-like permease
MSEPERDLSTDLGLVALAVIWGINFSVVKVVLDEIDPLGLNALRFPLAVLALALVVKATPGPALPERADAGRIVALGLIGNVAYQLCFIYGLDWTRAGNASLLLATTPVWTVLLSALAGHERPTRWVATGVVATLVGMTLVVGGGGGVSLGSDTVRGDLLMVLASLLWSVYTVAGRGPVSKYGALRVTAWALYVGTPILVIMGAPSLPPETLRSISLGAWIGVAYAGFLSIGLAYLLWYRAVRRIGNNRTAVYSNLVPVAALLTAWVWLGEVPGALQLSGAGVILAGLTVARLAQSPGPSSGIPSPTPSSSR